MAFRVCRIILILFAMAYAVALFLFLVGTFGWFGQPLDPLSAIFLLPLGLPWNQFAGDWPDSALLLLGVAAPLLNLLILLAICRSTMRGRF